MIDLKVNPSLNIDGGLISVATNTTLSITAISARDHSNNVDLSTSTATTVDFGKTGINGIDTGAIGASTMYAVYLVGDSRKSLPTGFVVSTSISAPQLPYGYDSYLLIGYCLSDGSSHLVKQYIKGKGRQRTLYWDAPISVLSGGTSATYAAVDCSGSIPADSNAVAILNFAFTPNAADDTACIRPTGSASTTFAPITGNVAGKVSMGDTKVPVGIASSLAKVDYIVTASGALTLLVRGFEYTV